MPALSVASPRPLSNLRKAGAIGDSITADAVATNLWTNWGWLAWARRYLAAMIDLPSSNMWAVGGYNVAQVRSLQLPAALAANLDLCFCLFGKNSLDGLPASTITIWADMKAIYDALLANSTFVVAIPIRVCNAPVPFTGDVLLQLIALNRMIAEYARDKSGMLVVDVNPTYLDFSTGNAQSGFLRDGIHDNLLSAKTMGKFVANAVSPSIASFDDRMMHLGDVFDAAKNPRGNLLANGLFSGTGGTTINGASGSVGDSWRLFRSANSGTLTAVGSKQTSAAYLNMATQRVTVGGTATGPVVIMDQQQAIGTKFSVGDVLQAEVEASYNLSTADFAGIGLSLVFADSGFATLGQTYDGYYNSANGTMPAVAEAIILRTDAIAVPASTAYVTVQLLTIPPSTGTPSGYCEWSRASLRKVF